MSSIEQILDMPNLGLDVGEVIQDLRDRRLLGVSAVAGYLEDLHQPRYQNFIRARWSRINNVEHSDPIANRFGRKPGWVLVRPTPKAGRMPKNKDRAVILGTTFSYEDDIWGDEDYGILPAAAFQYRGVARVGILPDSFGDLGIYRDTVAMLVGKNSFLASMGVVVLKDKAKKELSDLRRRDIKNGTLYLPDGVEIVDIVNADNLPESVPLV